MKVARGSVTPLVKDLLEDGLIYEGASGTSSRGRPAKLLYVRSQYEHMQIVTGLPMVRRE